MGAEKISQDLQAALSETVPGLARVENIVRLSGGANQETWSFDAVSDSGALVAPLILRRAPGGGGIEAAIGGDPDSLGSAGYEMEARLIRAAAQAGVPVPEVVAVLDAASAAGPGFVMNRIDGETIAPKILRGDAFAEARPKLAAQCGQALARIHAVPLDSGADCDDGLDGLARMSPPELLRHYRDTYDRYDWPHPVFELAFAWLGDRLNGDGGGAPRMTLVHGDFRNGNFIVGPEGLRAVIDWELAHIGDPMEDLGWICVNSWRFGQIDKPVGGFGDREDFYRAYEAEGGEVDRDRAHAWEVFGTLRWGVMCMTMADIFRSGRDCSVERAAVGRRASEAEIDLLRLIEKGK